LSEAATTSYRLEADVVVTSDEAESIHAPGAVEVQDGRISWVGRADETRDRHPELAVERLPGVLMPGLVNVHCHSPMTLFRGTGEGVPLDRWLREELWPREAVVTEEDVYWGMTLAAAESLARGVTTTCEMYVFDESVARAAEDASLRCVVCTPMIEAPGWERFGTWKEQLDRAAAHAAATTDLVEFAFGPHAAYTLPREALEAVAVVAREQGALVHIHVAETQAEGAPVEERYGLSVPALLAEVGLFDARVLAAHSVWLSDADLEIYRGHDVAVAHCPQSNMKLASGIARLSDMLALGIRVGLGTDGPASNNDLDLWDEMRLAPLVARVTTGDAAVITAQQAFGLATCGGAEVLGRTDIGVLAPGRWADMALLRMDDPAFVPILEPRDVITHLVWSASSRLVTDVWVGGRRAVQNGRCTTVDEAAARSQVQERAARLASAVRT